MSRLVVAALVRNEAPRYWRSALAAWSDFADRIVVLDDDSTDATAALARRAGAHVYARVGKRAAWGAEATARAELWDAACEHAAPGDWMLWLDADMVPMRSPHELARAAERMHADAVALPLYDLWGERSDGTLLYREDAAWSAHLRPRLWMVRRPAEHFRAEWPKRGIHCGHLPANLAIERALYAPLPHALLHYGYYDAADRHEKQAAYLRESAQLSDAERAHALTICDERPHLKPLLETPTWNLFRGAAKAARTSSRASHPTMAPAM